MQENENYLIDELRIIGDLNANDLKLKLAHYIKQVETEIENKNKEIEEYISLQAKFYGIMDCQEYITNVITSYKELINSIIETYDVRVINLIDSMKELEGNQIIALTNFNKVINKEKEILTRPDYTLDNKEMENRLLRYDDFINALIDKYNGYNEIIGECLFEYNICMNDVKKYISKLELNQGNSLINTNQNCLSNLILKIKAKFFGKKMFEQNVYNRIMDMINEMNNEKDSTIFNIKRGVAVFELTLKNLLEKVNKLYKSAISG